MKNRAYDGISHLYKFLGTECLFRTLGVIISTGMSVWDSCIVGPKEGRTDEQSRNCHFPVDVLCYDPMVRAIFVQSAMQLAQSGSPLSNKTSKIISFAVKADLMKVEKVIKISNFDYVQLMKANSRVSWKSTTNEKDVKFALVCKFICKTFELAEIVAK